MVFFCLSNIWMFRFRYFSTFHLLSQPACLQQAHKPKHYHLFVWLHCHEDVFSLNLVRWREKDFWPSKKPQIINRSRSSSTAVSWQTHWHLRTTYHSLRFSFIVSLHKQEGVFSLSISLFPVSSVVFSLPCKWTWNCLPWAEKGRHFL